MKKNQITYSCADFTFPLLSYDKVLQLIHLLDFEAVDLGIFENRSHHYPSFIAKDPIKEGEILKRKLNDNLLRVADVFFQPGENPPINATNSPQKSIRLNNREVFLKLLDFSSTLGSKHITGLPGVKHVNAGLEKDWGWACEETNWRLEAAKKHDIMYSIEAHIGSILPDPETTVKFIKDCSGLTLTLDYGHFIYQGHSNEDVHRLIPHASHFHARGAAKGQLQTITKENEIDYKTIMRKFNKIGYSGFITMEYVYQDWAGCNRTDNVSETVLLRQELSTDEIF